jgi:hypothetical protein
MRATGLRKRSGRQTQTSKQGNGGREMSIVTPQEKSFLDVFLHEATTSPFTGPATEALHQIGVEYGDISYIAWAYERDVPRTGFELGHAAAVAPPLPWTNREAVLRRNMELQRIWEQQRKPVGTPNAS